MFIFSFGLYFFKKIYATINVLSKIRLTPPYMLVVMISATLSKYWGNGPFWNQGGMEYATDDCRGIWWHNLFYINNFYPFDKMVCDFFLFSSIYSFDVVFVKMLDTIIHTF